ncbi:MAG TPA: 50S ribosomal protein L25 [Vicinamibacterales bacterium]|nr:50S ribosomal protein L25 [Vicinamibacterales bacterium]
MEAVLEAQKRDTFGKNEARRLRARGLIPGVLYGGAKTDVTAVAVNPKELMRILHSESGVNTLISLKLDGSDARVLVKEYQLDPIEHKLLHADFYRIAMDKMLTVTIPIVLRGEAKGVKQQGGVVDFVHREIEIECLPTDIPEKVEVDVSEMLIGQSIRVRDLPENPKWRAISEPDMMVVHVVALKAEPEPEEAAAAVAATPATPAEPEVIKKGKTEKPEEEKEK